LEIPVWDPGRIATLKRSKAAAAGAAADYRATALKAVEEIEGAYLNFTRRRGQLQSIQREQATAQTVWIDTQAKSKSGAGTFADENLAGRRYRDAHRMTSRLRLQLLDDYLALVRALGG
jgi:outer membrane protein TolC